jgi:hypothetical protein
LKGNLTWEERKIQREAVNKYTGENMTDETAESLRSLFIGELDLHAKKEINRQLQLMLSFHNFDGIDKLLRSIELHIVNDVSFFYFAVKVKFIKRTGIVLNTGEKDMYWCQIFNLEKRNPIQTRLTTCFLLKWKIEMKNSRIGTGKCM